jgi:hypothetical protein
VFDRGDLQFLRGFQREPDLPIYLMVDGNTVTNVSVERPKEA